MFSFFIVVLLIRVNLCEDAEQINTKLTSNEETFNFNNSEIQNSNKSTVLVNTEIFLSTTEETARDVHVVKAIELEGNNTVYKQSKKNDDFRPSPEVKDFNFQRNIIPVKPAYAEAKHTNEENYRKPILPWERPDDSPWNVNIRFPETKVPTSKDRPYKFEENRGRTYGFSGKNDYDSSLHKPSSINLGAKIPVSSSGIGTGLGSSWDLGGYTYSGNKYLPKKPSYEYDYGGYIEKPPTGIEHHGGYEHPVKKYDNPWKKIIKIIAAFIPIGLLISALTPTIITVTPMNNTLMRSRDDDPHNSAIKKLISSLGYFNNLNDKDCENRLLCELLLSASSSQNAEQYIENFLSSFADRGKYTAEREEELKMIFEAVKRQRCDTIICKGIKDNT